MTFPARRLRERLASIDEAHTVLRVALTRLVGVPFTPGAIAGALDGLDEHLALLAVRVSNARVELDVLVALAETDDQEAWDAWRNGDDDAWLESIEPDPDDVGRVP